MASETVDPIDWSYPSPYTGQYPMSSTYCTLQCGLQITRLAALSQQRTCDFRMPDQLTAGAAIQGINNSKLTNLVIRIEFTRAILLLRFSNFLRNSIITCFYIWKHITRFRCNADYNRIIDTCCNLSLSN